MDWDRSRVLVTGATGLIGGWLVKRLLEMSANVVVVIRDWDPKSELIRSGAVNRTSVVSGSLEEYASLERAINEYEIDTVFHLGAQTIVGTALRSPLPTFEANIRGTYNLLEACRVHRNLVQRVVVASSDKAYGEAEVLPYTEGMDLSAHHPYDVSKACSVLVAMAYAHTYVLPVAVARCGNVYGGGDLNWSRIVPGTIRSVLRNEPPIIRSNGRYIRDYIYVSDVVNAYLLLASRAAEDGVRAEAFNFSTGIPVAVLEIVQQILHLMGRLDLDPVILNQAEAEIEAQYLDAGKARHRLGWTPTYNLSSGLAETIAWYRDFLTAAERLPVG
jgi:CDP-glucose 4,6-dehydratase